MSGAVEVVCCSGDVVCLQPIAEVRHASTAHNVTFIFIIVSILIHEAIELNLFECTKSVLPPDGCT